MKTKKFLSVVGVCSIAGCFSVQATIQTFTEFDIGQNPSSPYYADFTSSHLSVSYTYSSSSLTGTFNASSTAGANTGYTAGSLAAGTHGLDNKGFNGSYSFTATVKDVSGAWQVTGGSLTVYGDLLGGNTSTVLLSANLRTGLNTINVLDSQTFEFLFFANGTGDSTILKDFFGTTDQGGVILHPGTYGLAYQDLTHAFSNTGLTGSASTFVPEPSIYAGVTSFVALIGFLVTGRNMRQKLSSV